MTVAEGMFFMISIAKLGPDNTPKFTSGNSSLIISLINAKVSFSIPLVSETIDCPVIKGAIFFNVSRKAKLGTAIKTISLSFTVASKS